MSSETISKAMDEIAKRADRLASSSNVDESDSFDVGIIAGIAKAVKLQCEGMTKCMSELPAPTPDEIQRCMKVIGDLTRKCGGGAE